jgi:hypothetical protein
LRIDSDFHGLGERFYPRILTNRHEWGNAENVGHAIHEIAWKQQYIILQGHGEHAGAVARPSSVGQVLAYRIRSPSTGG